MFASAALASQLSKTRNAKSTVFAAVNSMAHETRIVTWRLEPFDGQHRLLPKLLDAPLSSMLLLGTA